MSTITPDEKPGPGGYHFYLEASSAPLTCFLFALPLFTVYHAGLWWLNNFSGFRWSNAVDIIIAEGLGRLGIVGPLLSFILVVIVFLIMHAMSGKSWRRPHAYIWFVMVMESLVLALPVFMLSRLVLKLLEYLTLSMLTLSNATGGTGELSWRANMILSCGAGVYEEFFFRILIMGGMIFFLEKILGLRSGWKFALAAVGQALLFSAAHHLPGGPEEVTHLAAAWAALPVFIFRATAGIYFAVIYIERGFGIAAGCHAGYNLLVVLLDAFGPI
ncbi:MAG: CPBP family glutamic-type intramembrane protease [Planctomycetes bacterium]|nr:CPBP family glutamic-type intramembrane protease [Planctomycetota bacterium]